MRAGQTGSHEAMKIYTRKGDGGQTSIWGGRRLSKDDARIEAIGACDECNAAIGAALAHGLPAELAAMLLAAQGRLFAADSELMAPERTGPGSGLPAGRAAGHDFGPRRASRAGGACVPEPAGRPAVRDRPVRQPRGRCRGHDLEPRHRLTRAAAARPGVTAAAGD
jgi:hypothetical protein